ncbi:iron ABC transporter [Streptomyces albus]|uniref:Iron ABC transporter n=1 Tax=Streptomyces albus (strain ATCC 21838 / DSM 41398 / FERM P-419 / JCM 4703 / NBRC 107858) TaxID=1081613 RepID=A0A0B5EUE1_STRA4|nr:iron ABC transporter [Streptomyces albus]AOU77142.1 iron ABC transporter [Streptomyces albus]AYN32920.1 iron ABC transporter permease [Streptomyces albus]
MKTTAAPVAEATAAPLAKTTPLRAALVLAGLALALGAAVLAALVLGSVRIPAQEVLAALAPGAEPSPVRTIVREVRLPRVLLAVVVGAGLAVTGAVLQALVRNPLADPFLLGISSGASAGAVLVLVLGVGGGITTTAAMPAAAFAGALLALVLVYGLARRGGTLTGARLVLAGVAVSYILSALTTLLLVLAARPEHFQDALYWTLGGLGSARWDTLLLPAVAVPVGTAVLMLLARPLDLMALGEEGATVLGLDTHRFRGAVFVLASLLTAVMVAVSGAVGFLGLMVPHAARLVVGAGHRALLPVAALGGALGLVLADLAARTVAAPQDIPVGVLTALAGGPVLLWLMRRRPEGTPV